MLINKERLEIEKNCVKLNHCLYLTPQNTVIKDCLQSNNCPDFLAERILFVSQLPFINGYTHPANVFQEYGDVYGYEMQNLSGYINIGDFLTSLNKQKALRLPFEIKKLILQKVLMCLRELNKEYVISDINIHNIMFNSFGDGMIIDWENGTPITDNYPTLCLYELGSISNGIQADSLKLFTCALSLLYEYDFSSVLMYVPLDRFIKILQNLDVDPLIRNFIDDFSYELNIGSSRVVYFDEYLNRIVDIQEEQISRVKTQIFSEYYNDTIGILK